MGKHYVNKDKKSLKIVRILDWGAIIGEFTDSSRTPVSDNTIIRKLTIEEIQKYEIEKQTDKFNI